MIFVDVEGGEFLGRALHKDIYVGDFWVSPNGLPCLVYPGTKTLMREMPHSGKWQRQENGDWIPFWD